MQTDRKKHLIAISIAIFSGMFLWVVTAQLTGRNEAWDDPAYWSVSYPVAILICAGLGYLYPKHPWHWSLTLFAAQFVGMMISVAEIGNLWPLGLILFALISLPAGAAAKLASRKSPRRVEDPEVDTEI